MRQMVQMLFLLRFHDKKESSIQTLGNSISYEPRHWLCLCDQNSTGEGNKHTYTFY